MAKLSGGLPDKLKAVLSSEELKELNDGGEVSTEDILCAQMADGGVLSSLFRSTLASIGG